MVRQDTVEWRSWLQGSERAQKWKAGPAVRATLRAGLEIYGGWVNWERLSPGLVKRGSHKPMPACITGRLLTGVQIELSQDAVHVILHCVLGNAKALSNLAIGCTHSEFAKDF